MMATQVRPTARPLPFSVWAYSDFLLPDFCRMDARARLERLEIRAGRNFLVSRSAPAARPRYRKFWRRKIPCRRWRAPRCDRAGPDAAGFFGIGRQLFQLVIALLGSREFHQLHFLKLVLADDAAHIAPVGTSLAAETGRVGAELDGQFVGVQSFVAEQIRYGNFGRRRQPEIRVLAVEQIFSELRQLPCSVQAGGVDQKGGNTSV